MNFLIREGASLLVHTSIAAEGSFVLSNLFSVHRLSS